MAVTVKDVARAAGVSTATVSRVINNDPRISAETRLKVMECVRKLDYKINNIARSLKINKTFTIGFICPEIPNDFFMSIAKGVENESRRHGYSLIICNSNESAKEEEDRIKLLGEKCVDGIIIIPATGEGKHYKQLEGMNVPVVLADRLVENFDADAVLVDNINGSYTGIEYLISKGIRRIGFIGGNLELTSAKERYEGYKRALADYCIPLESRIIKFGDFHVQDGYNLMKEFIEEGDIPEYIFISNYYMHVGATKYLMENPEERTHYSIKFASFDDMELSSLLGFCKITVAQPMMEIGLRAAQMLIERINGETADFPRIIRLKTRLNIVNQ